MKPTHPSKLSESPPPSPRRLLAGRIFAGAAVAMALALAVCLGVRPLASPDLGYHLAYGEEFLDSGRIVDHNAYIYTLPGPGEPKPEPGPGCWYDAEGRYRFPNANWLSQVIMSAINRWAGTDGLCVLQAGLIAGIFVLLLVAMRRVAVPWPLVAAGLVLAAMSGYPRFSLRPEVFGYVLLMAQLCLLLGRRLTWPAIVAIVVLQLLFVNLHSYFPLSLAVSGAMLAEALAHWRWPAAGSDRPAAARRALQLGIVLAGQVVVCFANPWTWRLAVLPIQTLAFLSTNDITGGPTGHPWALIGEFFRPFGEGFAPIKALYVYFVLVGVAGTGALCCLLRRRWAWLLIIAAMTATSLSMRRNIAVAAMVITPLALGACWPLLEALTRRLSPRRAHRAAGIVSLAVSHLAGAMLLMVVTQRFYFNERFPARFGWGLSALELPLIPAEYLSGQPAIDRIWSDFNISSSIHYFTRPHPPVPILTNTWAYPPAVMREVMDYSNGALPFAQAEASYGLSIAVLRAGYASEALMRQLAEDRRWSLVSIDGRHVVFQKDASPLRIITPASFDTGQYIAMLTRQDPVPASALHLGGTTLYELGWNKQAAEVFAAAVGHEPRYYEAWSMRGTCLARMGEQLLHQTGNRTMLQEAAGCFRKALEIKSDYAPARTNLTLVERQLR